MKKVYLKRVAAVITFFVILSVILSYLSCVLVVKREDGVLTMKNFYRQPEGSCDVIFLGSSHAGANLDAEVFWREFGIPAYALWGSMQPFWNSYHYLLEALEYQTPKVVALDVYSSVFAYEYSDEARQETNTVGMRLGVNKWDAIRISAPKERWMDILAGFPLYHTRIGELTAADFQHFPWSDFQVYDKGTSVRYGTLPCELGNPGQITTVSGIYYKQEAYLRKIIALCKDEHIPLVLIKTPSSAGEHEQQFYNYIQQIADEYDVPFINMNLMYEILNISGYDIWTDGGHLNTAGSRKISRWLAEYLMENYGLKDRRGDPTLCSWDDFAHHIAREYLPMITSATDYFAELVRNSYPVVVIENAGSQQSDAYRTLVSEMEQAGLLTVDSQNQYGEQITLSVITGQGRQVCSLEGESMNVLLEDGQNIELSAQDNLLKLNDEDVCTISENTVVILAFDTQTGRCIDRVMFSEADHYILSRMNTP